MDHQNCSIQIIKGPPHAILTETSTISLGENDENVTTYDSNGRM